MAEIVLVTRSRRQKCNQRIVALDALQKLRLELLEVRSKTERPASAEHVAHELAVEKTVGKRETDAGRRFGVYVDDSPRAAHIADQIGGEKVDQVLFGLRFPAGVKEGRIAENKPRRNLPRLEQGLRAVEVLCDEVVKRGTLDKTALKLRPFLAGDDNRDQVYRPGLTASWLGEQVVGDPVFANETAQALLALELFLRGQSAECLGEGFPMRSDCPIGAHRFVETMSGGRVAGKEILGRDRVDHGAPHGPH